MSKVYESGSGKWIMLVDNEVKYTSNQHKATHFEDSDLRHAHHWFEDFLIYRKTLHAVPQGTNKYPHMCKTVQAYLEELASNNNS